MKNNLEEIFLWLMLIFWIAPMVLGFSFAWLWQKIKNAWTTRKDTRQ